MTKSDIRGSGAAKKWCHSAKSFLCSFFFCDSIFLRQVTIKSYPRGFLHLIQLYYQCKWIIIPPFYQHGLLICVFISGASAVILKDKVVILKLGCNFIRNVFLIYKIHDWSEAAMTLVWYIGFLKSVVISWYSTFQKIT